jgi:4-amino-4-deoxy-L-arabinose transferase-like glycosyltransferase
MFEDILQKCKRRKWELFFLFIIIAFGIFLRTYHFSDWLLFEIDQSYDTQIVSQAIENGAGDLPLLGPTAGGGRALRLGPAFYYMEYVSAFIFGNTPTGHAMLVLILSILAIPLFFLFIRKYFDTTLSLTLTSLLSMSAYLVLYGRFSWSPNVLPFLILLSFYALLRSVSATELKKDYWFLISVTAITITSQIHFNAFFTIPTIALLFLLYKRPKFKWSTWIIALGIVAIIYSPMILNDMSTHGENIGFFLKKVSKAGGSPLDPFKNFFHKAIVDLQYNASGYFLVNSGIDHISGGRIKGFGFQNDANLPWRIFAIILFLTQIALLVWNIVKEKMQERKDFLVLIFLWGVVPFAYFYSLISGNFQIYPRFYLLIAPVAIILLGLLLEKLPLEKNKRRYTILALIALTFLIPNVLRLYNHFIVLADPKGNTTAVEREDIFPDNSRLTLKEQLAITDYLFEKQKNNHYPVYINTFHEYDPMLWYHLSQRGIQYFSNIDNDSLYSQGNYFLIKYPSNGTRSIAEAFSVIDKKEFGALVVYTLEPNQEKIKALRQSTESRKQLEQTIQI